MIRTRRILIAAIAVTVSATALTGCAAGVHMDPAPNANDPACAEVTVRLPGELGDQPRRWTDAQATGAWGDPAAVLLSCGLEQLGPTTLPCQSVGGVDWVIDDADAPRYRVTSFGREPAVQLYIDTEVVSSADVLDAVSRVVGLLPSDGSVCTEPANG